MTQTVEQLDRMGAPNHLVPVDLAQTLAYDPDYAGRQYPLVSLMLPESEGCGIPERPVFIAKLYRISHWAERAAAAPPTWMDPELFVRQLRARTDLFQQADRIAEQRKVSRIKSLAAPLKQAFRGLYVPYIEQQFDAAAPLLAQWLVAHCATQQTHSSSGRKHAR